MKGAIVRLKDLSNSDLLVRVNNSLKVKMIRARKNRFKNMSELAEALSENEITLSGFFWGNTAIPVRTMLKLFSIFGIDNYEKQIAWIGGRTQGKGIRNPLLPFNFDTEAGGKFIAAVLGDGTIPKNLKVGYRNYHPKMLQEVMRIAKKLFGDVQFVYKGKTHLAFPLVIGKILIVLELKPGRKVITNPPIPHCVKAGSVECKIGFLRQISDDEGSVQMGPRSYSIRYEFAVSIPENKFNERERYVPTLLKDLHVLVQELGFSVTRIYGGRIYHSKAQRRFSVSWAFDIQGRASIEKFAREVGFCIDRKKKKLKLCITKMKRYTYGSRAEKIALHAIQKISKQKGYVTKHELADELKRSKRNAQEWLRKLERKRLVVRVGGNVLIGKGYCGFGGRTPLRYKSVSRAVTVDTFISSEARSCPKYILSKPYSH